MADPLSITAGAVGIVTAAIHATNAFKADLQRLSEAPATVEALRQEIGILTWTLESLRSLSEAQWRALGAAAADKTKATIASCAASCDRYRADLQRWTRHSSPDGSLSRRDRLSLGLFREPYVRAMSEQLQTCRTTLSLVVNIATLHSSTQVQQDTQALKTAITTSGDHIANSIASTSQQLAASELRIHDIDAGSAAASTGPATAGAEGDGGAEMRRVADGQRQMLKLILGLLEELRSDLGDKKKAVEDEESRQIGQVRFGDHSTGIQLVYNSGGIVFHGRQS